MTTAQAIRLDSPAAPGWRAARTFRRHRLALVGATVLALLALLAILADVLPLASPTEVDLFEIRGAPSALHPLGTDSVGRDVLSRLVHASRVSLSVGLVAVSLQVAIGVLVGAVAGSFGGSFDSILLRGADMVMSFPSLMLILVIVSIVGPSIYNIMVVLGVLGWPTIARLVRAEFLSLRERDFVVAATALGAGHARLIFRHMLPNTVGPIMVAATFGMAAAILSEAGLSFLGLGVQPPAASWGNLLADAQSLIVLESMPWLWLPPGTLILLAVLSINLIGDGLRDALDPRSRP